MQTVESRNGYTVYVRNGVYYVQRNGQAGYCVVSRDLAFVRRIIAAK